MCCGMGFVPGRFQRSRLMRAVWLLSINALSGRRTRTALLVGAVALATTLVAAVSCAMTSLSAGMAQRVTASLGSADIRVRHIGEQRFDAGVVEMVRGAEGVRSAAARLRAAVTLADPASGVRATLVGVGDPACGGVCAGRGVGERGGCCSARGRDCAGRGDRGSAWSGCWRGVGCGSVG